MTDIDVQATKHAPMYHNYQLLPITIIPNNTIISLFPNPTINVKPNPLPQVRPDRGLGRGLVTEECPWG